MNPRGFMCLVVFVVSASLARGFETQATPQQIKNLKESICLLTASSPTTHGTVAKNGTGFFINDHGLLLTARHTCFRDDQQQFQHQKFEVFLEGAPTVKHEAKPVMLAKYPDTKAQGKNIYYDIAILQMDMKNQEKTHYVKLGDPLAGEMGDDVLVIGYPQRDIVFEPITGERDQPFDFLFETYIGGTHNVTLDNCAQDRFFLLPIHAIPGLSGAPVYLVKSNSVVGMVSGFRYISSDIKDNSSSTGQKKSVTYPDQMARISSISLPKAWLQNKGIYPKDDSGNGFFGFFSMKQAK